MNGLRCWTYVLLEKARVRCERGERGFSLELGDWVRFSVDGLRLEAPAPLRRPSGVREALLYAARMARDGELGGEWLRVWGLTAFSFSYAYAHAPEVRGRYPWSVGAEWRERAAAIWLKVRHLGLRAAVLPWRGKVIVGVGRDPIVAPAAVEVEWPEEVDPAWDSWAGRLRPVGGAWRPLYPDRFVAQVVRPFFAAALRSLGVSVGPAQ